METLKPLTYKEIKAMPLLSAIHRVESSDVHTYKIIAHHESFESICISRGTNDGLTKWVNKESFDTCNPKTFATYNEAVDCLIIDLETDLALVRDTYYIN